MYQLTLHATMNHLLFLSSLPSFASFIIEHCGWSTTHSFSGTIKSAETGEALIGASILVKELKTVGASSNAYGFYSLTIPKENTHSLSIYRFRTRIDTITLDKDQTMNFPSRRKLLKKAKLSLPQNGQQKRHLYGNGF